MDPTKQSFPPWPCLRGPKANNELDFYDTYVNLESDLQEQLAASDLNRDSFLSATARLAILLP
jgi:hypothetical protein